MRSKPNWKEGHSEATTTRNPKRSRKTSSMTIPPRKTLRKLRYPMRWSECRSKNLLKSPKGRRNPLERESTSMISRTLLSTTVFPRKRRIRSSRTMKPRQPKILTKKTKIAPQQSNNPLRKSKSPKNWTKNRLRRRSKSWNPIRMSRAFLPNNSRTTPFKMSNWNRILTNSLPRAPFRVRRSSTEIQTPTLTRKKVCKI